MKKLLLSQEKLFLSILIIFIMSFKSYAQDSSSFVEKNIRISGNATAYGELYSISGHSGRRPPSTARLVISPTITLFNLFSIPIEILVSTEGSSARQNINQFGINPSWEWGTFHLGDFNENYSTFTLNGVTIRGAGIDIHPGIFNFSTVAGFTRRAVAGGAGNGSYKRFLFASKLGLGQESGTHFDLIVVRAKDKVSSLSGDTKAINVISPNGGDEIPLNSVQLIQWNSTNITGLVKIELSRDGGNTYETLFNNQPATGSAVWNVTGTETFQAVIKISAESDSSIFDVSDKPFIIAAGVSYSKGNIYSDFPNSYAVTPQENLILGISGKTNIYKNMISLNLEADGSAYTKDLRASEIDLSKYNIPGFVNGIYKPRVSSSFDYALNSGMNFHIQNFNAKLGYEYIGPGYTSLGLSYLQNDQQKFSAATSFRISKFMLNLNWSRFNDNLISQKLFTTVRSQYGLNLSGAATNFWNMSFIANILGTGNSSNNDTTKIDFSSIIIGTNHTFSLKGKFLRSINLNYTYQNSTNKSVFNGGTKSNVNSFNLGFGFILSKNINANASAGVISSSINNTTNSTTQTYAVSLQHKALKNKLVSSFTFGTSILQNNTSIRAALSSGYSITSKDRVLVTISFMHYKSGNVNFGNFNELIAGVTISHRF